MTTTAVTLVTFKPSQGIAWIERAPYHSDLIRDRLDALSRDLDVGDTSRMVDAPADTRLRASAIAYVESLMRRHGDALTSEQLNSFVFEGHRLSLVGQRGIRTISGFDAAFTIMTTYTRNPAARPYDDEVGPDDYLRYKWQGTNPDAYDNVALRVAMGRQLPLIWFFGVAPGVYMPVIGVTLVAEEPELHQFVVALDDESRQQWNADMFHPVDQELRRQYVERIVRERVHQRMFRQRVLLAYDSQCAMCRLRHVELLDAAHIKGDREGGEPVIPNGVSMCAIHHRAFDNHVLGITPAYEIRVRPDVLSEEDGPTLRHALQEVHKTKLILPHTIRARPDATLLEERYELFLAAS